MIQNVDLKQLVLSAEEHLSRSDLQAALEEATKAFYKAVGFKGSSGSYDPRESVSAIKFFSLGLPFSNENRKLGDAFDRIASSFGEAIMVVGYGLDFERYRKFKDICPVVHGLVGGAQLVEWMRKPPNDPAIVSDCIDFVTDTCIKLAC